MSVQEFEITIEKSGKVKVHLKGIKGPQCLEWTKLLGDILGAKPQVDLTSEYYEPGPPVRIDVRGGR